MVEQLSGVATEVYKDSLSPSIKPVGTVLSLLPRTIRLCFSGWEKWIINGEQSLELTAKALKDKVDRIPENKLCEPEPYVAIPAIQQLTYCQDNEVLRELYANLLASSMNADTKWEVHPSYTDIIKQLCPDEAKLLRFLPRNVLDSRPVVDIVMDLGDNKGTVTLLTNFATIGLDALEKPTSIGLYMDNLARLGIIKIRDDRWLVDNIHYKCIENHSIVKGYISDKTNIRCKHKLFIITNLGLSLINVCSEQTF